MPADRFSVASARLFARLKARVGVSVTYTRNAGRPTEASETVTAVRGNELEQVTNPGGQAARVDTADRDYLILASDLLMGEPEKGDRITDAGEVFELKPVQGNPAWRWSDHARVIRRVHTTQVH